MDMKGKFTKDQEEQLILGIQAGIVLLFLVSALGKNSSARTKEQKKVWAYEGKLRRKLLKMEYKQKKREMKKNK